eukprot:3913565-Pyramimonas_sp.AAC.1
MNPPPVSTNPPPVSMNPPPASMNPPPASSNPPPAGMFSCALGLPGCVSRRTRPCTVYWPPSLLPHGCVSRRTRPRTGLLATKPDASRVFLPPDPTSPGCIGF